MSALATRVELDPIDFEIFAHRLWAIGEEGRIALQRVTASPIVAQGGECMCSFYDADGAMILACSGHLRFAAATSDAIKRLIEWFEDDPGIHEGDEFIFNDPYVAGSHTYDIMQICPIFWEGRRVGWVASSSHTADTGGVLRGAATEIFHEGIRLLGLKIVDGGIFRQDVFKTIVEQCRDPHYVGMDLKSRTAANHVCARGYLALIERFGVEFVEAAGRKLIADAETMARARLATIPDGTWASRIHGSAKDPVSRAAIPYEVRCTATKHGDELTLDFTGSSEQLASDQNSTLPSTMAHVAIALTNQLFWDVPWSDGRMAPVTVIVPEGTALNCRFPAACGRSPRIGQYIVEAVRDCLARMLFASGTREGINASWGSFWYLGGPGFFYGGHDRRGTPVPQGLYDIHGGGLGAAPTRDGVPTGGQTNIPSGGISDVERIELQYPFLYLSRRHLEDGGGAGRWNGGTGSARLVLVHGSDDLTVDLVPYAGMPHGAAGLFGGYPVGSGGVRAILEPTEAFSAGLQAGRYPTSGTEAIDDGWAVVAPPDAGGRAKIRAGMLLSDFTQGGGGFGDPLDRPAPAVADDVARRVVSRRIAAAVYGVHLAGDGFADEPTTERARAAIRGARRDESRPPAPSGLPTDEAGSGPWTTVVRFHAVLELASAPDGMTAIRCTRCDHALCPGTHDWRPAALRRDVDLEALAGRPMPDGSAYLAVLREYACPGCATLLEVESHVPSLDDPGDGWDVRLAAARA
ncbi:MAG TPA: hydantoinase B/oxoprolinase family protein [Candidatus Saccharimonadales bacterium]|nr:hydantoinase B/oxoprolinase family protein [Candidatus Saccharimonadales bacterium]